MNNTNRLEQLFIFLKETPDDPFLLYAIAMELEKTDKEQALVYYENLLKNHGNYLGMYYQIAKFYENAGNKAKATSIYEKGIALARKEQNLKAVNELQNALNNLLYDDE
jgi:tetratricopeptide (TPR) repeat protein